MIDYSNKQNSNLNNKDAGQSPNLANKPSGKNDKKYQKLVYRIADVTSEEEGYPASELLNHTPYSRGWQSARYAEFPQEIILEFGQSVRVKQIQFLSHQYKISKKIELMIYNPNSSKKFKKIGYLSLDSNERSNYQARELKSVYIDHDCKKIKVILHSAWENNHNLFRQVGLISINVQGEYENKISDLNNFNVHNNNNTIEEKKNEEKNTFEDNIKYDPNTLAKLKSLNAMKDEAIASEDYDKAQTVKNAINRLKSVANKLVVLEERKQIAIKNEQFDQAKLLKFEIESLRDEAANFDLNQINNNNKNVNTKPNNNANTGFNKLKKNTNNNKDDLIDANYGEYDENNQNELDEFNNNQRQQKRNNSRTPMGKDMKSNQNTKAKFDYNNNNNYSEDENNNDNFNNNNNNNSKSNFNNPPTKQQSDSRNNLNTPNNQNNMSNNDNNYNNNNITNNSKKPNFRNNSGIKNNDKSPVDVDNIVIKGNNQNFDDLLNEKMREEKLNKQKISNDKQQSNLNNLNNEDNAQESDDIPEKEYPIAEPFIGIFTYELVKLLFSKAWKKKEEGLKQIEKEISKYPKSSVINSSSFGPDNVLYSAFGVADYILNSNMAQPSIAAMDLLKSVLAKFSKENINKPGNLKQDFQSKAEKIVGLLLEKTADANPKLKEKAEMTINEFADSPLIGPKIVLNHLLNGKVKKTLVNSAKHLMSRLNLLNRNIDLFGLDGIDDLDAFVQFAVNGFKNPNKDVRDSAFNLIMNIYKFIGDDIKKHFKDLRPAQVSALEEGFDGVEVVGMTSNANKQINKNLLNENKPKGNLPNKAAQNQGSSGSLEVPKSDNPGNKSAKPKNDNRRKSAGKIKINQEDEKEEVLNNENIENQMIENNNNMINNNDLQCDFCGYSDENLDEDTLALHLYKQCAWLTSCFKCKQTVEVCSLNTHLINECQAKKDFRVCSRCKEPILANQYEKHIQEKSCIPAKNQNVANRCPLCHTDMTPAGKNGWTLHLLEEGCPKNPRGRY